MSSQRENAADDLALRGFATYAVRLGDLVMARAEAALAPLDLKPLAFDAMRCIYEGHGQSQRDLSRRLGIYAPKLVGIIDGLETRGLVERTVSPTDRRRHVLVLTGDGLALLRKASAIAAALEKELFQDVSAEDKTRFRLLVEALEAAAKT